MNIQIVRFAYCIDPALGRLGYASLHQQTLLEMLTDGLTNRENIGERTEEPEEISDWKGLTFDANTGAIEQN